MARSRPNSSNVNVTTESETYEAKVTLYGYNEFKKILKEVDPDLRKEMDREIRSFITPVSTLAKSLVPQTVMRNWRKPTRASSSRWAERGWDQAEVVKGIRVRQGGKRSKGAATSSAWKIQNTSPAGAIYETAGRRSAGEGIAGQAFVAAITLRGGRASRLIWRAWDDSGGDKAITRDVVDTINKYENELQRRLNLVRGD